MKDPKVALNPRSPAYRKLGLKERELSRDEVIDLIHSDVNLMKRPLVIRDRKAVFGWKPEEYEEQLL